MEANPVGSDSVDYRPSDHSRTDPELWKCPDGGDAGTSGIDRKTCMQNCGPAGYDGHFAMVFGKLEGCMDNDGQDTATTARWNPVVTSTQSHIIRWRVVIRKPYAGKVERRLF